jgi:hypothetical protein
LLICLQEPLLHTDGIKLISRITRKRGKQFYLLLYRGELLKVLEKFR